MCYKHSSLTAKIGKRRKNKVLVGSTPNAIVTFVLSNVIEPSIELNYEVSDKKCCQHLKQQQTKKLQIEFVAFKPLFFVRTEETIRQNTNRPDIFFIP